jgi:hypothetical protein
MVRSAKQSAASRANLSKARAARKRMTRADFQKLGRMDQLKADVPAHWKFGGPPMKPEPVSGSAYSKAKAEEGHAYPINNAVRAARHARRGI